jgi:hypothetical protein
MMGGDGFTRSFPNIELGGDHHLQSCLNQRIIRKMYPALPIT